MGPPGDGGLDRVPEPLVQVMPDALRAAYGGFVAPVGLFHLGDPRPALFFVALRGGLSLRAAGNGVRGPEPAIATRPGATSHGSAGAGSTPPPSAARPAGAWGLGARLFAPLHIHAPPQHVVLLDRSVAAFRRAAPGACGRSMQDFGSEVRRRLLLRTSVSRARGGPELLRYGPLFVYFTWKSCFASCIRLAPSGRSRGLARRPSLMARK